MRKFSHCFGRESRSKRRGAIFIFGGNLSRGGEEKRALLLVLPSEEKERSKGVRVRDGGSKDLSCRWFSFLVKGEPRVRQGLCPV